MLAYLINLAMLICINAILAVTLNFILGYAGIFSLAHAHVLRHRRLRGGISWRMKLGAFRCC